tara:strand:- start:541 stop:963 length:423 start_codon:yes stop_codon:yes gene_type:complete
MKFSFKTVLLLCLLTSCSFLQRNDLSEEDISYMEGLGLLDKSEQIIWFDSQLSVKKSGNFLSDKRLASYFLGGNEQDNFKQSAYLNEIDSINLSNKSETVTYSSYIEVFKKDGEVFKVYIDKDSTEVGAYFKKALKMLED